MRSGTVRTAFAPTSGVVFSVFPFTLLYNLLKFTVLSLPLSSLFLVVKFTVGQRMYALINCKPILVVFPAYNIQQWWWLAGPYSAVCGYITL